MTCPFPWTKKWCLTRFRIFHLPAADLGGADAVALRVRVAEIQDETGLVAVALLKGGQPSPNNITPDSSRKFPPSIKRAFKTQ